MPVLSIVVIVFSIIFVIGVCWQVGRGRLLLRYSLLWLFLALIALLCAIFPQPVFNIANALGFDVASNFVLFVAVFFLLAVCLSLSVIVSKQQTKIKDLVQHLALLEKRQEKVHAEWQRFKDLTMYDCKQDIE